MRYMIKQKIFSFGDSFSIKDQAGNDCYKVKGRVFTFGNKLSLFDLQDRELVYIEQKLFRFLPEYNIYYNGSLYATVKKEFSFFNPKFKIFSNTGLFRVEGNLFGMDFTIYKDNNLLAQVSKKWFSFSDTYGIDIIGDVEHPFMLALVIVIDQVLHDNRHNNG